MTEITETLTVERLDELEAIARKATSGPWSKAVYDEQRWGRKIWVYASVGLNKPRIALAESGLNYGQNMAEEAVANGSHITAFDPPTALSLLALAREGLAGRAEIEREEGFHSDALIALNRMSARATKAEAELAAAREDAIVVGVAYKGACSLLLDVQQECIAEHKRADAAEARVRTVEGALFDFTNAIQREAEYMVKGQSVGPWVFAGEISKARAALTPPTEPAPVSKESLRTAEPGADTL